MMAKRKKAAPRRPRKPAPEPEERTIVEDGILIVEIKGGPHNGTVLTLDPMVVKLACEEMERKHRISTKNGEMYATPKFAQDLSASLTELGYTATPTVAVRIWSEVSAYFHRLQKKTPS